MGKYTTVSLVESPLCIAGISHCSEKEHGLGRLETGVPAPGLAPSTPVILVVSLLPRS